MVPLMIGAGYDLRLFSMLTVSPAVSLGYSYNTISYQKTLLADMEPESAWEPVALGGLDVTFHLGQSFLRAWAAGSARYMKATAQCISRR